MLVRTGRPRAARVGAARPRSPYISSTGSRVAARIGAPSQRRQMRLKRLTWSALQRPVTRARRACRSASCRADRVPVMSPPNAARAALWLVQPSSEITPATRSGARPATWIATMPPMLWPPTHTGRSYSTSRTPTTCSANRSIEPSTAGGQLRPWPGSSITAAATSSPSRSMSGANTARSSKLPGISTSGGSPAPPLPLPRADQPIRPPPSRSPPPSRKRPPSNGSPPVAPAPLAPLTV